MIIHEINYVGSPILGQVRNLNSRYFEKIDASVGLFQSTRDEVLKWLECGKQQEEPAYVVPREEFKLQKKVFLQLEELENCFNEEISTIVWFGKNLEQNEKCDIDHVVAHELKHVEQRITDLKTYYKDRTLSFVLKGKAPTEIDANNFANMTTCKVYDKEYNWVKKTQELFDENLEKINKIYKAIIGNEESLVINEDYFFDLSQDQNKRNLYRYYYERVISLEQEIKSI